MVSGFTLVCSGAALAVAVLAMLHMAAAAANRETAIHKLRVDSLRLRAEYMQKMAKLRAGLITEAEVEVRGNPAAAAPHA